MGEMEILSLSAPLKAEWRKGCFLALVKSCSLARFSPFRLKMDKITWVEWL